MIKVFLVNPYHMKIEPCDAKISEKCLCYHHNITDFMKQLSHFNTVLVMKGPKMFNSKL